MSTDQGNSSTQLLYSEYMNTNDAKHVVQLIENKNKEKPVMKFTKSSALSRVLDLLPRMKQGEAELKAKDETELNIEVCEENCPIIEMNVAIPNGFNDNESDVLSENSNEANSEVILNKEDSEESSEENTSSSEESDNEDIESLGAQKIFLKQNNCIMPQEEKLTPLSSGSISNEEFHCTSKCLKSAPLNLIDKDNVSDEPPTKKLCQLLD